MNNDSELWHEVWWWLRHVGVVLLFCFFFGFWINDLWIPDAIFALPYITCLVIALRYGTHQKAGRKHDRF